MRIYEINAGDKEQLLATSVEKYREIINRDCSDAVSVMRATQKPLYRGFASYPSPAFIGQPRLNRQTYTKNSIVEYFNDQCDSYGFKANRSNSVSCTTSQSVANTFGDLFYLFPVNGFNFLWSTKIDDFGSFFGEQYLKSPEDVNHAYNIDEDESWITTFGYTNENFAAALQSKHEISIAGKYIAIEVDRPVFGQENKITFAQLLGIK